MTLICGGSAVNKWAVDGQTVETVPICVKVKEQKTQEELQKKKKYEPPALEAVHAVEVGSLFFFMLFCAFLLIILFDLSAIRKDWRIFKK